MQTGGEKSLTYADRWGKRVSPMQTGGGKRVSPMQTGGELGLTYGDHSSLAQRWAYVIHVKVTVVMEKCVVNAANVKNYRRWYETDQAGFSVDGNRILQRDRDRGREGE